MRDLRFLYDSNQKLNKTGAIDYFFLQVFFLSFIVLVENCTCRWYYVGVFCVVVQCIVVWKNDIALNINNLEKQNVGEMILAHLQCKEQEYNLETPNEILISVLEDVDMGDQDALDVYFSFFFFLFSFFFFLFFFLFNKKFLSFLFRISFMKDLLQCIQHNIYFHPLSLSSIPKSYDCLWIEASVKSISIIPPFLEQYLFK